MPALKGKHMDNMTVAYIFSQEPYYFEESLTEIKPLVKHCVIVFCSDSLDIQLICGRARNVLNETDVSVELCKGSSAGAVDLARARSADGWLLILNEDECVDRGELERATRLLHPRPNDLFGVPTIFFWHDKSHALNPRKRRIVEESPRLIWVGSNPSSNNSPSSALANLTKEREDLKSFSVFNYSYAIPRAAMEKRFGPSCPQTEARHPADKPSNLPEGSSAVDFCLPSQWFSPWWELGLNREPNEVIRHSGRHPSAMADASSDCLIHDLSSLPPNENEAVLVWEGWIGQEISLGVATEHIIHHLEKDGWDPHLYPVNLLGPVSAVSASTRRAVLREAQAREHLRHHTKLITVKYCHTGDWTMLEYAKARLKIGYSPQERTAFVPMDVKRANRMDLVMVTSSYVQRVAEASGVDRPFYVCHHGYDPQWIQPIIRPARSRFTFLSVSVLNLRKGPDLLLQAFDEEFRHETDVHLIVKTSPHVWHQELHEKLVGIYGNHPQITFLQHHHTDEMMARLYHSADCFVLPTRGEGFGLPTLEAMATGLPVITTNWSGHLDFCNSDNSYLIDVTNKDQLEFAMGCEEWWASPDQEHLRFLMRYVYEHQDEAFQRGQRAAQEVAEWTWDRQVSKLSSFLRTLL